MYRAAVVTVSDRASRGEYEDRSGKLLCDALMGKYEVTEYVIIPDEFGTIKTKLEHLADTDCCDVIFTTGGTGLSPRDVTPEATMSAATRNVPGIAEAMRYESMKYTSRAMLSRGVSVIRNSTLIINLPGSPKAVSENLAVIEDVLVHALDILKGERADG